MVQAKGCFDYAKKIGAAAQVVTFIHSPSLPIIGQVSPLRRGSRPLSIATATAAARESTFNLV